MTAHHALDFQSPPPRRFFLPRPPANDPRAELPMDKLKITGGVPLAGEVAVAGAKNAALPILAAALLTGEPLVLENVPQLADVATMGKLLRGMGATVEREPTSTGLQLTVQAARIESTEAPYELVKTMRASILVLGPLLARQGEARVLMAACLAEGETVIENAAREPEVVDLARLLVKMGAQIRGAGTDRIVVQGVAALHGVRHAVMPDRIETGTFAVAAAASGIFGAADVLLAHAAPASLDAVTEKLRQAGARIDTGAGWMRVRAAGRPRAVNLRTAPYPAFPTDMQAQLMALDCVAEGTSHITETIFENRFMHVLELQRLGASIAIEGNTAIVQGVTRLSGASVMATDLRASASLVIAGLLAEGITVVDRIYHLDRGYDRMERRLTALGARIERIK